MSDAVRFRELALGTCDFGTRVRDDVAAEILRRFSEGGGEWVDTANNYADWRGGEREAEKLLGRYLPDSPNLQVVTKAGYLWRTGSASVRSDYLLDQLGASLRELRRSSVELFMLHRDDPEVPVREIEVALCSIMQQGLADDVGVTNWSLDRYLSLCDVMGRWIPVGGELSLLRRRAYGSDDGTRVLDASFRSALGRAGAVMVLPFRCLASGRLASHDVRGEGLRARLDNVASQLSTTRAGAAIAYVRARLGSPGARVIPIVGVSTAQQLEDYAYAARLELPQSAVAFLEGDDVQSAR